MFDGFTWTVLILIIFLFLWLLKRYLRVLYLSQQFLGPVPWPLIGNADIFFNIKPEEVVLVVANLFEKYGKTVKIWFGFEFSIFMSELKDVELVLGTTVLLDKSSEYSLLRPWLTEGLLISRPRKWFKRRKVLTPAFHFKILDQFIEIFNRESTVFVKNLQQSIKNSEAIDLNQWITLLTLDTICESAMGVSINAQTNADSEYVRAVKTISTVMHKRMFDILYRFDLTYKFTKLAQEEKKALNVLHSFTEKIIVQRREEILKAQENKTKSSEKNEDITDVGAKRKMAFLDILLQSEVDGKPLTNLDIREEVDTFMFEGHDTTSSAINFFFYNIAINPECQRKCVEEIVSVLGKDKNTKVTYEYLNQLHYIELCIKETLRLFPSVPLLGRKVLNECEINGKTIPAGTNIGISPLHLGRMEELFPDPNSFKPERFDVVTSAEKMNPYAYIPFSAGPRNCIGQKFAMLEIKTVVANVLRNFEVEFVGNAEIPPMLIAELILRPKDPLMFKMTPRVY
ncbi:cytochrome P450 4d1 isoform X2 [Teleopsis dalmanni]|uniref:cytochrome P450 4d1 isoform X2 n=1 Tax=Teleopsis dalmanni TaxID=139649 RepID=UPI0018CE6C36|nr:cytochrome P450 4d1 isoform X2 [Teleopsis dalmanni]